MSVHRHRGRWGGAKTDHRLLFKLSTGNKSTPYTIERHRISLNFLCEVLLKVGTLLEKAKDGKRWEDRRGTTEVIYTEEREQIWVLFFKPRKRNEAIAGGPQVRSFQKLSKVGYSLGKEPRKIKTTFLK